MKEKRCQKVRSLESFFCAISCLLGTALGSAFHLPTLLQYRSTASINRWPYSQHPESRMRAVLTSFFCFFPVPTSISTEFRAREQSVLATFNDLQVKAEAVMDVISNPEVVSALRQDKLQNLNYLKENHNVRPHLPTLQSITALYMY
jgi:hypothetical protein